LVLGEKRVANRKGFVNGDDRRRAVVIVPIPIRRQPFSATNAQEIERLVLDPSALDLDATPRKRAVELGVVVGRRVPRQERAVGPLLPFVAERRVREANLG